MTGAKMQKVSIDSFLVYAIGVMIVAAPYKIMKGLETIGGWLNRCSWISRWLTSNYRH